MRKLLFAFVAAIILSTTVANAQIEKHQVTFIYNFTRLIQWPNIIESPVFTIGVLGRNHPLTEELKAASQGRTAGGRQIEIVEYASTDDLSKCHILFVPNNRLNQLRKASEVLKDYPVLYVTETQGRQPAESVVNLFVENERLAIRIDEDVAKKQNLLVSNQLINFSR
jgi:hypothetical protein